MNVRVITGDPDQEPLDASEWPAPDPATLDEAAPPAPVSVGDRVRKLLVSNDKAPFYPRLLRLKNVDPNSWQRALLVEGMIILGGLVALADRATAWAPVVLPVGAAVVVKFHDVLAGLLPRRPGENETATPPAEGDAAGTNA